MLLEVIEFICLSTSFCISKYLSLSSKQSSLSKSLPLQKVVSESKSSWFLYPLFPKEMGSKLASGLPQPPWISCELLAPLIFKQFIKMFYNPYHLNIRSFSFASGLYYSGLMMGYFVEKVSLQIRGTLSSSRRSLMRFSLILDFFLSSRWVSPRKETLFDWERILFNASFSCSTLWSFCFISQFSVCVEAHFGEYSFKVWQLYSLFGFTLAVEALLAGYVAYCLLLVTISSYYSSFPILSCFDNSQFEKVGVLYLLKLCLQSCFFPSISLFLYLLSTQTPLSSNFSISLQNVALHTSLCSCFIMGGSFLTMELNVSLWYFLLETRGEQQESWRKGCKVRLAAYQSSVQNFSIDLNRRMQAIPPSIIFTIEHPTLYSNPHPSLIPTHKHTSLSFIIGTPPLRHSLITLHHLLLCNSLPHLLLLLYIHEPLRRVPYLLIKLQQGIHHAIMRLYLPSPHLLEPSSPTNHSLLNLLGEFLHLGGSPELSLVDQPSQFQHHQVILRILSVDVRDELLPLGWGSKL